jgi:hydroxyacylglutathione hydrolase
MEDLTRKLMRIGLDNIFGFISKVEDTGIELHKEEIISIDTFKQYLDDDNAQIIDVRGASEFEAGHIENAENIFVGTLPDNLEKISKTKTVVIHCQSGDRSALAYSILAKNGFGRVKNFSGGMKEWLSNKEPVVRTQEKSTVN